MGQDLRGAFVVLAMILASLTSGCLEAARDFAEAASEAIEEGCGAESQQEGGIAFTGTPERYPFTVPGPARMQRG